MIWYPYEQMKTMKAPYKITDANGVYLYTEDNKMIDSVSSWWSVIHGYKHPELGGAIISQVEKFSHVMLGGLTHDPVEKLSEKLQSFLPGDLDYCFFSDSGSVAVEVGLKMALQYFMNKGETERTMVMSLEHSYHGDTFKAMEVGDDEDYHFVLKAYGKSENVIHIPTEIDALEEAFEKYHSRLNSFIVEPLLQGAGGMRMYDISFLKRGRELCDKYGVLLIFDEVATGFGRTGNRFLADIVLPDILILGKALTGGYIGHALTASNHKVYDRFCEMIVHPGINALLDILCECIRRHGDYGYGGGLGMGAFPYCPRRLIAVHLGHLHIHQDCIEGAHGAMGEEVVSHTSIAGEGHTNACFF